VQLLHVRPVDEMVLPQVRQEYPGQPLPCREGPVIQVIAHISNINTSPPVHEVLKAPKSPQIS
jgi:hypothetical protein